MKGRLALNNAEAVLSSSVSGNGYSSLPSFIIGQSIRPDNSEVLSAYRAEGSSIWIGYQKSRYILPKIRTFDYYSAWIKAQSFI